MTDGPRQRGNAEPAPVGDSSSDTGKDTGVALKKEIGLVSACGIIVGKSNFVGITVKQICYEGCALYSPMFRADMMPKLTKKCLRLRICSNQKSSCN